MLGQLLGVLGIGLPEAARRVRPNPYAPHVPDQLAIARYQGFAQRGTLSGRSGSDADFARSQSVNAPIRQSVDRAAIPTPVGYREPNIHYLGLSGRTYTGPVDPGRRWGLSTRGRPHVIASTLLPPGQRTPSPRDVVAGREAVPAAPAALADFYEQGGW